MAPIDADEESLQYDPIEPVDPGPLVAARYSSDPKKHVHPKETDPMPKTSTISDWCRDVHDIAATKGWWPAARSEEQCETNHKLALIALRHLELSQDLEDVRAGRPRRRRCRSRRSAATARMALAHRLSDADKEHLAKLALIHSEVSEAVEAVLERRLDIEGGTPQGSSKVISKPEGAVVELADVVIRIMDWCARWGLNLEKAMTLKVAYNSQRRHRHGGKLA